MPEIVKDAEEDCMQASSESIFPQDGGLNGRGWLGIPVPGIKRRTGKSVASKNSCRELRPDEAILRQWQVQTHAYLAAKAAAPNLPAPEILLCRPR